MTSVDPSADSSGLRRVVSFTRNCETGSRRSSFAERQPTSFSVAHACRVGAKTLQGQLPIFTWAQTYDRRRLMRDLIAGVVLAVLAVPQCLAYASLQNVPLHTGMYAAVVGCFVYFFLGSCSAVILGPAAETSLILAAAAMPSNIDATDPVARLGVFQFMALQAGFFLFVISFMRGGTIIRNCFAKTVADAYSCGAGIMIFSTQLATIINVPSLRTSPTLHDALIATVQSAQISATVNSVYCALLFLILLGYLLGIKKVTCVPSWIPQPLVIVVVATLVTWAARLDTVIKLRIMRELPTSIVTPTIPSDIVTFDNLALTAPTSLIVAVMMFLSQYTVCQQYEDPALPTDPNIEIRAGGVAGFLTGVFQGFPGTAAFSRAAVSRTVGASSPVASLATSVVLCVSAVALTRAQALYFMPRIVLAALLCAAAIGLVSFQPAVDLFRKRRYVDFLTWLVTFLGVLFLGTAIGILLGIVVSICFLLLRMGTPSNYVLGFDSESQGFVPIELDEDVTLLPGVLVWSFDSPITFVNVHSFRASLLEAVEKMSVRLQRQRPMSPASSVPPSSVPQLMDTHDETDTSPKQPLVVAEHPNSQEPTFLAKHPWLKAVVVDCTKLTEVDASSAAIFKQHISTLLSVTFEGRVHLFFAGANEEVSFELRDAFGDGLDSSAGKARVHVTQSLSMAVSMASNRGAITTEDPIRDATSLTTATTVAAEIANRSASSLTHDDGSSKPPLTEVDESASGSQTPQTSSLSHNNWATAQVDISELRLVGAFCVFSHADRTAKQKVRLSVFIPAVVARLKRLLVAKGAGHEVKLPASSEELRSTIGPFIPEILEARRGNVGFFAEESINAFVDSSSAFPTGMDEDVTISRRDVESLLDPTDPRNAMAHVKWVTDGASPPPSSGLLAASASQQLAEHIVITFKWGGSLSKTGRLQAKEVATSFVHRLVHVPASGRRARRDVAEHVSTTFVVKPISSGEDRVVATAEVFLAAIHSFKAPLTRSDANTIRLDEPATCEILDRILDPSTSILSQLQAENRERLSELLKSRSRRLGDSLAHVPGLRAMLQTAKADNPKDAITRLIHELRTFLERLDENTFDQALVELHEAEPLALFSRRYHDRLMKLAGCPQDPKNLTTLFDYVAFDIIHNANAVLQATGGYDLAQLFDLVKHANAFARAALRGITESEKYLSSAVEASACLQYLVDFAVQTVNDAETEARQTDIPCRLAFSPSSLLDALRDLIHYCPLTQGHLTDSSRHLLSLAQESGYHYLSHMFVKVWAPRFDSASGGSRGVEGAVVQLYFSPGANSLTALGGGGEAADQSVRRSKHLGFLEKVAVSSPRHKKGNPLSPAADAGVRPWDVMDMVIEDAAELDTIPTIPSNDVPAAKGRSEAMAMDTDTDTATENNSAWLEASFSSFIVPPRALMPVAAVTHAAAGPRAPIRVVGAEDVSPLVRILSLPLAEVVALRNEVLAVAERLSMPDTT